MLLPSRRTPRRRGATFTSCIRANRKVAGLVLWPRHTRPDQNTRSRHVHHVHVHGRSADRWTRPHAPHEFSNNPGNTPPHAACTTPRRARIVATSLVGRSCVHGQFEREESERLGRGAKSPERWLPLLASPPLSAEASRNSNSLALGVVPEAHALV